MVAHGTQRRRLLARPPRRAARRPPGPPRRRAWHRDRAAWRQPPRWPALSTVRAAAYTLAEATGIMSLAAAHARKATLVPRHGRRAEPAVYLSAYNARAVDVPRRRRVVAAREDGRADVDLRRLSACVYEFGGTSRQRPPSGARGPYASATELQSRRTSCSRRPARRIRASSRSDLADLAAASCMPPTLRPGGSGQRACVSRTSSPASSRCAITRARPLESCRRRAQCARQLARGEARTRHACGGALVCATALRLRITERMRAAGEPRASQTRQRRKCGATSMLLGSSADLARAPQRVGKLLRACDRCTRLCSAAVVAAIRRHHRRGAAETGAWRSRDVQSPWGSRSQRSASSRPLRLANVPQHRGARGEAARMPRTRPAGAARVAWQPHGNGARQKASRGTRTAGGAARRRASKAKEKGGPRPPAAPGTCTSGELSTCDQHQHQHQQHARGTPRALELGCWASTPAGCHAAPCGLRLSTRRSGQRVLARGSSSVRTDVAATQIAPRGWWMLGGACTSSHVGTMTGRWQAPRPETSSCRRVRSAWHKRGGRSARKHRPGRGGIADDWIA